LRDQFELGPKLTARAGLSEDERNQLRALGYLQD
jgi:hypothetical protein